MLRVVVLPSSVPYSSSSPALQLTPSLPSFFQVSELSSPLFSSSLLCLWPAWPSASSPAVPQPCYQPCFCFLCLSSFTSINDLWPHPHSAFSFHLSASFHCPSPQPSSNLQNLGCLYCQLNLVRLFHLETTARPKGSPRSHWQLHAANLCLTFPPNTTFLLHICSVRGVLFLMTEC